ELPDTVGRGPAHWTICPLSVTAPRGLGGGVRVGRSRALGHGARKGQVPFRLRRNAVRAITIRQPWAELIVRGEKDVENRSWRTRHRGPLLIHAGGRAHRELFEEHGVPDSAERGAIIGVVEVVDCRLERSSEWHEPGSWGWYLTGARRFEKPIPMKG